MFQSKFYNAGKYIRKLFPQSGHNRTMQKKWMIPIGISFAIGQERHQD